MSDENVVVHECYYSDKVVKVIPLGQFKTHFKQKINDGTIDKIYLTWLGNLVAKDVWGIVRRNILLKEFDVNFSELLEFNQALSKRLLLKLLESNSDSV